MGSPLSQLCRHHTALQTTITWVWDIFLQHLSQELYFPSRFCFTPGMCSFMFAFICLSHLSFYLYYPFLFMYAHYWISWWSGNSNLFDLESRNCFDHVTSQFYDVIPFDFKYMFDHHERMNSKSRRNQNFDHFHPSAHTYAKVTIHIHSKYRCISTLCHSRAIFTISYCWNLDNCTRNV